MSINNNCPCYEYTIAAAHKCYYCIGNKQLSCRVHFNDANFTNINYYLLAANSKLHFCSVLCYH